MPIYEYVCNACGHAVDVFQGMNDPQLTECPKCHQAALTKLISAAGFRLKGGGWYETDFKKEGDKKKNLVSGTEPASVTPKSDSGKETVATPAPKPKTESTE